MEATTTISQRIKKARREAGITQPELALKIGGKMTQQTLSKLERGLIEHSKYLTDIALALDVSPFWLETGKGEMKENVVNLDFAVKRVPIISWVAAGDWSEAIDIYPAGHSDHWELCPIKHGKHTFGLQVKGESMSPRFNQGDIIFCDPEQEAFPGDFVIAKRASSNEATFKQLVMGDDGFMLKAVNPHWHQIYMPCEPDCRIIGKVIGRIEKF